MRSLLLAHLFVSSLSSDTWEFSSTSISERLPTFGELHPVVSLRSASFVTSVGTSLTTASVPWWCRLCTQHLSWSGLQPIYRGTSSLLSMPWLVCCFDYVVTTMSRMPLQLCTGCVYHSVLTSRWLSWRSACCTVSRHHYLNQFR